jgi:lipoate-protein ligase B
LRWVSRHGFTINVNTPLVELKGLQDADLLLKQQPHWQDWVMIQRFQVWNRLC